MDYPAIENAVVKEIRNHFNLPHPDLVVAGDIDTLMTQLIGEGLDDQQVIGCLLEYGGGVRRGRTDEEAFKTPVWQWSILGVIMIRFTGAEKVEDDLRAVVERLSKLFSNDHTLGGVAPWVRMERIDQPVVARIQDMPFYWVPFEIVAYERVIS